MVQSKALKINCKTGEAVYIDVDVNSEVYVSPTKTADINKLVNKLIEKGIITQGEIQ